MVSSSVEDGPQGRFRQTQGMLRQGHVFGDSAIRTAGIREHTVTTFTEVQLLVIGREDYINIFIPELLTDGVRVGGGRGRGGGGGVD